MLAMANGNHVLLLWLDIFRLRIPSLLFVRVYPSVFWKATVVYESSAVLSTSIVFSMRYSRMLEESSFANKKADYFWLLLQSSVMLLVCRELLPGILACVLDLIVYFCVCQVPVSACQPALPLVLLSICAHLSLVATPPLDAYLSLWANHDHGSLSPYCARRVLVGTEWNLEGGCGGPGWVRSRPCGLVPA